METQLIRILPACLSEPLPEGWSAMGSEYVVEVMPDVEQPEAIPLSIQSTEPDILLLDTDFPDLDPFSATEAAVAAREGLAVVFLSSDNSPESLRRAMLAGAEEYLIKPIDVPTLQESLTAIASHRTLRTVDTAPEAAGAVKNGLIVGVVSGKGGLGKTTIAANMAALVAKTPGKTAALVGLESGDGSVLLSLQPRLGLLDLASAVSEDESNYSQEWLKQFGTTHRSGLSYWAWSGSATQANAPMPDDFLTQLFNVYRGMTDVTLVDFPLLSAEEAVGVLPLLDVILVISSSSDLLALRSTKTFLDTMPEELGPRVRLIINRADPSDMISQSDFESTLGRKVAAVLPNQPDITAPAINMGSPFVLTQPQSDIAVNLRTLAQTLFKLPSVEDSAPKRRGFRLFG